MSFSHLGLAENFDELNDFLIKWFKSYLRYQQTYRNNKYSNIRPISTEVLQGSILGPILFITYVNGLTAIPRRHCYICPYIFGGYIYPNRTYPTPVLSLFPTINQQIIEIVPNCKYIGLFLNNQLSFKEHTVKMIGTAA